MLVTQCEQHRNGPCPGAQSLEVTHQSQTGWGALRVLSEEGPGFHKEVTHKLKSERLVAV